MNVDNVPFIGELFAAGPNDRVFDSLLLTGPLLIVVVAVLGRSSLTLLLVIGYLVTFVGYTISKGIQRSDRQR